MNQGGARKPKADEEDDNGSFLDEAFNERTIVHSGPSPLARMPEPTPIPVPSPAPAPRASAAPVPPPRRQDFDHTPITQPHPPRSALDDVLNDRTTVLPPRGSAPSRLDEKPEPKASDFEFNSPPPESKPEPDFNYPPVPPRPAPSARAKTEAKPQAPTHLQSQAHSQALALDNNPKDHAVKDTGSVSFDSVRPHDVPATDDWDFRAEKTHAGGVQHWVRKASSIPRQHQIAVGVVIALGLAFLLFRGNGKMAEPVVVESETQQQDHAQASAKPAVPTVDSVLQLFDIAYAKTQGQARSDQNSP